jgi:hypothetical protein
MTRPKVLIAALGLGLVAALGSLAPLRAQEQSIASNVESVNDSGITGTMRLINTGSGKTRVEVRVNGAGAGPQPIHIHDGICNDMNPEPKIPLTNVVAGSSITDLDVSVAQLTASPHAIYLHRSPQELPVFVACANINSPVQRATIPATGEGDSWMVLAPWLVGLGAGLAAAGLALRRAVRRAQT